MEIWIITAGCYADENIVGVTTSADEAAELLARAQADPRIRPDFDEDYTVYGPYGPGKLHDHLGRPL